MRNLITLLLLLVLAVGCKSEACKVEAPVVEEAIEEVTE
jgi:uncharacterized protein YcfL